MSILPMMLAAAFYPLVWRMSGSIQLIQVPSHFFIPFATKTGQDDIDINGNLW